MLHGFPRLKAGLNGGEASLLIEALKEKARVLKDFKFAQKGI